MQETKGKRACRQGVWGSARLWERSWAARHTEDVRGDLRLHTIGQKEGKIHHYLDTSKDNCNSRCTGRSIKSSSSRKITESSHFHVLLPHGCTKLENCPCINVTARVQFSILHAWPAPLHDFQVAVCLLTIACCLHHVKCKSILVFFFYNKSILVQCHTVIFP